MTDGLFHFQKTITLSCCHLKPPMKIVLLCIPRSINISNIILQHLQMFKNISAGNGWPASAGNHRSIRIFLSGNASQHSDQPKRLWNSLHNRRNKSHGAIPALYGQYHNYQNHDHKSCIHIQTGCKSDHGKTFYLAPPITVRFGGNYH